MRIDPHFPPASHQVVPPDRAETLLMPAGFDAEYLSSDAAAGGAPAALPVRQPDLVPGWRKRLVGYLLGRTDRSRRLDRSVIGR